MAGTDAYCPNKEITSFVPDRSRKANSKSLREPIYRTRVCLKFRRFLSLLAILMHFSQIGMFYTHMSPAGLIVLVSKEQKFMCTV
jgi:hypothetical protein